MGKKTIKDMKATTFVQIIKKKAVFGNITTSVQCENCEKLLHTYYDGLFCKIS